MEESKESLLKRLAENQARLDELGPDRKSARKRILTQVSKIKAQLSGKTKEPATPAAHPPKKRKEPSGEEEHHGVQGGISKKAKKEQKKENKRKQAEAKGEERKVTSDKKKKKLRLQWLNKQISSLGQRKELTKAEACFDQVEKEGLIASVHTYTSIINAQVRSGEIGAAERYMDMMREAGLKPNVVTYTALLKGHTQAATLDSLAAIHTFD